MWGIVPSVSVGSSLPPLAFSRELLPLGEDGVLAFEKLESGGVEELLVANQSRDPLIRHPR